MYDYVKRMLELKAAKQLPIALVQSWTARKGHDPVAVAQAAADADNRYYEGKKLFEQRCSAVNRWLWPLQVLFIAGFLVSLYLAGDASNSSWGRPAVGAGILFTVSPMLLMEVLKSRFRKEQPEWDTVDTNCVDAFLKDFDLILNWIKKSQEEVSDYSVDDFKREVRAALVAQALEVHLIDDLARQRLITVGLRREREAEATAAHHALSKAFDDFAKLGLVTDTLDAITIEANPHCGRKGKVETA